MDKGTIQAPPTGAEDAPAQPAASAATHPLSLRPAIDAAAFQALQSSNGEILPDLLRIYFEHAPRLLANLREALAQGSSQALFQAAHSLKSSSATMGALSLAGMCKELEATGKAGVIDGALEKVEQIEAEYARARVELQHLACQ